ncbi:cadherin-like domain-containing protein, partial [Mariniblastus sp.]|nr:cadherin-like domain-containing protein [Mariniblastus sp.]
FDSNDATDGTTYTLTINVTPVNDAPTGQNNEISTVEDTPKSLAQADFILSDVDGDPNVSNGTINISSVAGGTIELGGSNISLPATLLVSDLDNLVFNPTADSNDPGSIDFSVTDSDGVTDGATYTLTINVTPVNDAPSAQSNTITTDEDTPTPLAQADFEFMDIEDQSDVAKGTINISSIAGGTVTIGGASISAPTTLSRTALDQLIFNPAPNSSAGGAIEFQVFDSAGATDGETYTLTINVTTVNDAPTLAVPTFGPVSENSLYVTDPVGSDVEDGFARWAIVGGADAAKFVNDAGTLRFVSAPDFENSTAQDGSNEYRVRVAAVDSDELQSAGQLLTVRVADVNEAPIASRQQANANVQGIGNPARVEINLNNIVADADSGDSVTFSILDQADRGRVTIDGAGNVFYEPTNQDGGGQDSFQFVGTDSQGLQSQVVTVDLDVANEIIIPGSANTNRDNEVEQDESTDDDSGDDSDNGDVGEDSPTSTAPGRTGDEDASSAGDQPGLVSTGLVAASDSLNDFNNFDDDETTLIESDILSDGSARTYSYSFNLDEIDLTNQLSAGQNIRRTAYATQFDVNVLASAFLEELDHSKHDFIRDRLAIGTPEVAVSAASLLTVGYLVWNMGSGILLSTFMSSLPAWAAFDVLPVISSSGIDDEDDESIEQMVDA